MNKSGDSGYSMNNGNGNVLPVYLRYDPLYCEIHRERPHQVAP